jgi:phosphoenolpyruvate carboxykinase (GTP)
MSIMRASPDSVSQNKPKPLIRWVEKMAELCTPQSIHWVDGSEEENAQLCAELVKNGTFIKLNEESWPGCYYARSDPTDVARVEDRTFICSLSKYAAGPTNNWVEPFEMRKTLKRLFKGCMAGRTMYVLPFSIGPIGSPMSQIGVQLTDSPYVVVNTRRKGDRCTQGTTRFSPRSISS